MLRQVSEPEMPELFVEVALGGIALLIQRFQIAKDLGSPLAANVQTGIIGPHAY
jgi:hypothetical protein